MNILINVSLLYRVLDFKNMVCRCVRVVSYSCLISVSVLLRLRKWMLEQRNFYQGDQTRKIFNYKFSKKQKCHLPNNVRNIFHHGKNSKNAERILGFSTKRSVFWNFKNYFDEQEEAEKKNWWKRLTILHFIWLNCALKMKCKTSAQIIL